MNSLSTATVNIALSEITALQDQCRAAELALAKAEAEVERLRILKGEDATTLVAALTAAIPIVQFAVASHHPLTVRGWPYQALHDFGAALEGAVGIDPGIREVAKNDFKLFAQQCERWERARAEGREQADLDEENEGRGITGEHPILSQLL